ncbi:hypothetical protein Fcan01_14254 [Folsomia candida]|uniref:Solute carrier family 25 member 35 n=1 Tax=Folsomia candida TaxID=158441 RepID=A0A226DZ50_FOLCA|nr:hypothetical protein Fcan01_14254 [Folsomia candida]
MMLMKSMFQSVCVQGQCMELVLGGTAAVCAAFWTNPLEVVKIRMQLQGELQAKGNYAVHYRNVFHAAYTIATKEGATAIQKGLVPALWYQFVMNGIRLGLFHKGESRGFTKNGATGKVDPVRSVMVASVCGATGGVIGSPFCLVTVGHQHSASGMCAAVKSIFQSHGVLGLWRGMSTTLVRVVVVSAVQLPTFAKAREYVTSKGWFPEGSVINAFIASLLSGVLVSIAMAPLDLVSTRFYNQGVDAKGKGEDFFYSGGWGTGGIMTL